MKILKYTLFWQAMVAFLMVPVIAQDEMATATGDAVYAPAVDSRLALASEALGNQEISKVVLISGAGAENISVWLSLAYQFDRSEGEYNELVIFVDSSVNRSEMLIKGKPLLLKNPNDVTMKEYAFVLALTPGGAPAYMSSAFVLPLNGSANISFKAMSSEGTVPSVSVTISSQYKDGVWTLTLSDVKESATKTLEQVN